MGLISSAIQIIINDFRANIHVLFGLIVIYNKNWAII